MQKDKLKPINPVQEQLLNICRQMDEPERIQFRVDCVFCGGTKTLVISEHHAGYFCLDCRSQGSLDEIESEIYRRQMEKPSRRVM